MELLLSEGDGAEEVEEVEVLKHRREGHAMNEERGVRRRDANIVLSGGKMSCPRSFQTTEFDSRTEQTGHHKMGDNMDLADPTMGGMMNFEEKDAFAEADQAAGAGTGNKVHIRVQQRNRKKCVLTIQGLDDDLDLKKICKAMRKNLQCNGAIVQDKEFGDVIQLQGDHRAKVGDFLCKSTF
jgi:translation initiation factor 1